MYSFTMYVHVLTCLQLHSKCFFIQSCSLNLDHTSVHQYTSKFTSPLRCLCFIEGPLVCRYLSLLFLYHVCIFEQYHGYYNSELHTYHENIKQTELSRVLQKSALTTQKHHNPQIT